MFLQNIIIILKFNEVKNSNHFLFLKNVIWHLQSYHQYNCDMTLSSRIVQSFRVEMWGTHVVLNIMSSCILGVWYPTISYHYLLKTFSYYGSWKIIFGLITSCNTWWNVGTCPFHMTFLSHTSWFIMGWTYTLMNPFY